jgi:hypothetical protein
MHDPKVAFEYDQEQETLRSLIKKSMVKENFAGRLLPVRTLMKIIDKTEIEITEWQNFRLSVKQKKMLKSWANAKEIEVSEYIRMVLFS